MAVRAGHPARPARTDVAAGRWSSATPRDRPTRPPAVPGSHRFPRPLPSRGSDSSPGPKPPHPSRRIPPLGPPHPPPVVSGSPQVPVRTPHRGVPGHRGSRLRRVRCDTRLRRPVADRPAPISPGSSPPARTLSGSSARGRPARAAPTIAVRYRIHRCRPRRPRAATRSPEAPVSTATSSPHRSGRPERCPAHLRSPRRARQPPPPRRWRHRERA